MNIANWLYQTALSWPDRPAIFVGETCIRSYRQFAAAAMSRARAMAATHGVCAGDRIAIFMRNAPEYLELMHAIWWLGATVVPINHKLHPNEALWIAEQSGAKIVFTETGKELGAPTMAREAAAGAATDLSVPLAPPHPSETDDLAWLFYTSGTTGRPKGAMLSHENLRAMTMCYALDVDHCRADDAMIYAAPVSHGAGLYMFAAIRAGAAHLVPSSRGFDSEEIISLARSHGNLVFFAAPTMVKRLVAAAKAQGFDGTGIRTIIYGGGPMYKADIEEALDVLGPRFVQIYGQGETPMTISVLPRALVADTAHPRCHERRASVGFAQACVSLRILGPSGETLGPGETGEIAVKSPTVMRGYWHNPQATAETIRDGWLLTGDLGHIDEDGFLYLTDRSRDVIISGGTNIYPREVEEVLVRHPAVFEAAVIGEPEPEWGEQVVAFVVFRHGMECSAAELDAFCRNEIASFKRPKRYRFVSDLPKNSYGKVLKSHLRAR